MRTVKTIYILSAAVAAEALRQKVVSPDDPHFQEERTALPGDLRPGCTYYLSAFEPRDQRPAKPWVKWKQHPKGPRKMKPSKPAWSVFRV